MKVLYQSDVLIRSPISVYVIVIIKFKFLKAYRPRCFVVTTRRCLLIKRFGFDSLLCHMFFLYWRIIPSTVCMDWVFLCFIILCLCSLLCCLRKRLLHSANHRSGDALQLFFPVCGPYKIPVPLTSNKWYKGKFKKKNMKKSSF